LIGACGASYSTNKKEERIVRSSPHWFWIFSWLARFAASVFYLRLAEKQVVIIIQIPEGIFPNIVIHDSTSSV
jgi:hypothetical protein